MGCPLTWIIYNLPGYSHGEVGFGCIFLYDPDLNNFTISYKLLQIRPGWFVLKYLVAS